MMKRLVFIILIFCIHFTANTVSAQTIIHPKIGFIGIHPFEEPNRNLFDNHIDANRIFVVEPMAMVSIETMILGDTFSWRIMPGFYNDAAAKAAFFLHAGLKLQLFRAWRHSLHLAAGGSLLGRQLWETIPGYIPESGFSKNGTWEYRIEPFAELEYDIFINESNDITMSGIYGYSYRAFTFTIGYRHWLSTRIKHPRNCGSCPFQKSDKKYRK